MRVYMHEQLHVCISPFFVLILFLHFSSFETFDCKDAVAFSGFRSSSVRSFSM